MDAFFDVIGLGSIIVDDLVYHNGSSVTGNIGGSVPYALAGAAMSGAKTNIWAFAGVDYYPQIAGLLQAMDIGTDGLICRDVKQPRAFQYFDEQANRREVFQTPWENVRKYAPTPAEWPENLKCRAGYLFVAENIQDYCAAFRRAGADYLVWEPPDDLVIPERDKSIVLDALPGFDVVVPNFSEWRKLFPYEHEIDFIKMILSTGVKIVALRMGDKGSVLASSRATVYIPVEPVTKIVDFTGAGNTYAGAISAAIVNHPDPESIEGLFYLGACASVASACTIESLGLPKINPEMKEQFHFRLNQYFSRNLNLIQNQ